MTPRQEVDDGRRWLALGWYNAADRRLYRMDAGAGLPLEDYLILPLELQRIN